MNPSSDAELRSRVKESLDGMLVGKGYVLNEGVIFTGPDGNIIGLADSMLPDPAIKDKIAGFFAYSRIEDSFNVDGIRNKPGDPDHVISSGYHDEASRRTGKHSLLAGFEYLAERSRADKMIIHTWMIPANPGCLTDPDSFFFGWKPSDIGEHETAVRYFIEHPVRLLREHDHKFLEGEGRFATYTKPIRNDIDDARREMT